MTNSDLRVQLGKTKADREMPNVVTRLGFKKETGNTCLFSRKSFRDQSSSQLPFCRVEMKLSDVREISSKAESIWNQRIRGFFPVLFFYSNVYIQL